MLAGILLSACGGGSGPPIDFSAAPLSGGKDIQLAIDYKDKPVVVYFWATWCGPCKMFAPALNQMAGQYQPKGIAFLAISSESRKLIQESEKKEPHKMTVLLDTISSASEAIGATALPTIVILNKDHKVVWGSQGIGPTTASEMKAALDGLV